MLWGLLSLPFVLLSLLRVVEPMRRARGKEPLGYYGCLLHVALLCVLLSPLGFLLWLLMTQVAEMF